MFVYIKPITYKHYASFDLYINYKPSSGSSSGRYWLIFSTALSSSTLNAHAISLARVVLAFASILLSAGEIPLLILSCVRSLTTSATCITSSEVIFSVKTLYHLLQLAPASSGFSLKIGNTFLETAFFEITGLITSSTFSTGTITSNPSVRTSISKYCLRFDFTSPFSSKISTFLLTFLTTFAAPWWG